MFAKIENAWSGFQNSFKSNVTHKSLSIYPVEWPWKAFSGKGKSWKKRTWRSKFDISR